MGTCGILHKPLLQKHSIKNMYDYSQHFMDNLNRSEQDFTWGTQPDRCSRRVFPGYNFGLYLFKIDKINRRQMLNEKCPGCI